MKKPARRGPKKGTGKVVKRLPAEQRRREIVARAAQYFADRGFDGGTRDLARYLNVTQPLLYRYFPTKEHIIREVYQAIYLDVWRPTWDELLVDRSRSLKARLRQFYLEYTEVIMNEQWMRIYFFSALRGAEINKAYIGFIEERILRRVMLEFLKEHNIEASTILEKEELEHAWFLQASIFYYGVRLYVYKLQPALPIKDVIDDSIEVFLEGYRRLLRRKGLRPSK